MKLNKLLVLLSLVTSIFTNHIATPVVAETTSVRQVSNAHDYSVQWTNNDFGDYYEDIDFSSYSTIKSQLQSLNSSKRRSTVGYSSMPSKFYQTDYDPNNKSKVIGFYTNRSATYSGNMNREHVWPNSRGGGSIESDIHVIRPTFSSDNSSRGNSFYVEGMKTSQNGWDPKTAGMLEESRGYAARIIFYSCIANSSLQLVDKNTVGSGESGYRNTMGKLSDLLKWNLEYAVDITELNRNNGAEDLQGNRNPFIDNPYLACAIWGNYNEATRQICADYDVIVDPYTGDITLPDTPSGGGSSGSGDSGNTGTQTTNWGTSTAPITTDQAIANMANFADKQTSSNSGYVKGTITSISEISSEYKNVTLTLDNDFIVYRCKTPNDTYNPNNPEVKVGDEIVVCGTYQKWIDLYEITSGQIISVSQGGSGSTTPEPEDPTSLNDYELNISSYEYQGNRCVRFGAQYPKNALDETDKFGILVFSKNQLGSKKIEDLYTSGNLNDFKQSITKYAYLDFNATNSKKLSGDKYCYGAIITNCDDVEDFFFTAVGYFEVDGELIFTKQVSTSYLDAQ